jgi:hypothetical protein
VIVRALALALRGHRELVLENLALRQQLTAVQRTSKWAHLQTHDRLFWIVLARSWPNWRRALVLVQPDTVMRWHRDWLAADGPDVRNIDGTAVHRSISRSARSFERWPGRTRCGERRGFTANCAPSVSTLRNARCRVFWNRTHVRLRRRGGRFLRIIAEVVSAPGSPWQNPYIERLICSIRRECLDHVIVLNEAHLRRVLTIYSLYYHRSRTHLGLEKDTPDQRPVSGISTGAIIAIPEVGGLHHRYERRAA